jgi:hypothetical protein
LTREGGQPTNPPAPPHPIPHPPRSTAKMSLNTEICFDCGSQLMYLAGCDIMEKEYELLARKHWKKCMGPSRCDIDIVTKANAVLKFTQQIQGEAQSQRPQRRRGPIWPLPTTIWSPSRELRGARKPNSRTTRGRMAGAVQWQIREVRHLLQDIEAG